MFNSDYFAEMLQYNLKQSFYRSYFTDFIIEIEISATLEKHLLDEESSFSRNVPSLDNIIEDIWAVLFRASMKNLNSTMASSSLQTRCFSQVSNQLVPTSL